MRKSRAQNPCAGPTRRIPAPVGLREEPDRGPRRVWTVVHFSFINWRMRDAPAFPPPPAGPSPGQTLARGVCRHLLSLDFAAITELVPAPGLRVDVMALGPRGEVWVVECKSSRADFAADRKWQGYLEWCDRFFFAVDASFPTGLLPEGTGLMLADGHDAEILRMGPEEPLAPARRRATLQRFARHAALRLLALRDPAALSPSP